MKNAKLTKNVMIIAIAALLLSGTVVYAATTLFTQTIPAVTFSQSTTTTTSTSTSVSPSIAEGCSTLVLDTALSNITFVGQSGELTFACSGSTGPVPAFSINPGFKNATVTPVFTLQSGWSLSLDDVVDEVNNGGPGTCIGGPWQTAPLTSGVAVSILAELGALPGYVYCLNSTSAASLSSFTVTWSQ